MYSLRISPYRPPRAPPQPPLHIPGHSTDRHVDVDRLALETLP